MPHVFQPYPGFPEDPARLEEVRRRVEATPRGQGFHEALAKDAAMVAVYKTDVMRKALENNALKPEGTRRTEAAVIRHQAAVFDLAGI